MTNPQTQNNTLAGLLLAWLTGGVLLLWLNPVAAWQGWTVNSDKRIGPPHFVRSWLDTRETPEEGLPALVTEPFAPSLDESFESFNYDDNAAEAGIFFIPPDPIGAAGSKSVIAVGNVLIEARDKHGTLLFRDALQDFFAPLQPQTFAFDPKIVYDHYEDRFVVVALEQVETGNNPDNGNSSRILLAVSKTDAPGTATDADWYYHAIDAKVTLNGLEHWADYPGFEVDEEAVYITANLFQFAGGDSDDFAGTRLWIVDKGVSNGFYGDKPASVFAYNPYEKDGLEATTMPCLVFGTGGVRSNIGTFLVAYSGITLGGATGVEAVQVVRVDDPLGAPIFTPELVEVDNIEDLGGSFGFPALPDAPQSGTDVNVEVNDRRALDCVWRNDQLYLVTTIEPRSGPNAGQTTAHWFQLDTTSVPGGTIKVTDQGDVGGEDIAPGTFTFFPSIAVDSMDNMAIGFSASAPTIFPGAYYTGREVADAAGTVQASEALAAGKDYYVRTFDLPENRWGDYSGIAVDPSDDETFWVFNEYALERGSVDMLGEDGRWGTKWGSFSLGKSLQPPGAATLIAPVGTIMDIMPTYRWNEVSEATQYFLQVNDAADMPVIQQGYTSAEADCSGGNCAVTPSTALVDDSSYTWWIQTRNEAGPGPLSEALGFTVSTSSGLPLAATLISPSGTINGSTPTYIWNAVSSATWYFLWVNDSTGIPVIQEWYTAEQTGCAEGSSICSITPPTPLADGSYLWWIQTWNEIGLGPWSDELGFTVSRYYRPGN